MIVLALLMAQSAASPGTVTTGERIFAQSCSVGYCHGAAGAAGRGPRLRGRNFDESYLLGVIRDGIPHSAMPAWKGRMPEADILAVVRYIESLSGGSDPATVIAAAPETRAAAAVNLPPQAERGRQLFFDSTRDTPCSTCHELDERGSAVGPDLHIAGKMTPGEIAAALRGERPSHLVTIRTTDGEVLTAVMVTENAPFVKFYDLTAALPVLRTLEQSQIRSREPVSAWSHKAYLQGLGAQEWADLIGYLRWVATRDTQEVSTSDLK